MISKQNIVLEAFASAVRSFRWVALILFMVYALSGTVVVQPGEIALVLRFGRLLGVHREEQIRRSGLLFALPYPIDRVIRVPIKEEGEVLIKDLWKPLLDKRPPGETIDPLNEGYCLTGDQNILQARLVAKYRIDDPIAFVFSVENPKGLVHDAVMAATTQNIAGWRVNDALRLRDDETQMNLATLVQQSAQQRLDSLACGLVLSGLEFKEVHPPRHLRAEFERAQSARVEKETRRREAEGFASSKIPQAEAERNRLVKEALANASGLHARATAEVSVFRTLYEEYRRNPTLTRERIHREALEQIMSQIGKRFLVPPSERPGDVRLYISESENAQ